MPISMARVMQSPGVMETNRKVGMNTDSSDSLIIDIPSPVGLPPGGWAWRSLPPAGHQAMLDTELIEDSRHDEVHQVIDAARLMVEARRRRRHHRPQPGEMQQGLRVA